MRWKAKQKPTHKLDETRVRNLFVFLPRQFGDTWVCLEWLWIEERYVGRNQWRFVKFLEDVPF